MNRREFLKRSIALTASLPLSTLHSETPERILQRTIPSTGEGIPAVGMGTWQTFDAAGDRNELAALTDVLRIFAERGGRLIDSSPMYGSSESVAGQLCSDRPEQFFFSTKVWTTGLEQGKAQMVASIRKLRPEGPAKLELMQIHNLVDWRTHMRTLRAWKEAGTFRYIGITHYLESAFDDLMSIVRQHKIDFVQLPYSVATRGAEERLLPLCRDRGVATLINRPYEGGALFREVRGKDLPQFVRGFADSWGQAFLKFILAHEAVTCVIPATSKPKHMRDNMGAGFGRLPDADECRRLALMFR